MSSDHAPVRSFLHPDLQQVERDFRRVTVLDNIGSHLAVGDRGFSIDTDGESGLHDEVGFAGHEGLNTLGLVLNLGIGVAVDKVGMQELVEGGFVGGFGGGVELVDGGFDGLLIGGGGGQPDRGGEKEKQSFHGEPAYLMGTGVVRGGGKHSVGGQQFAIPEHETVVLPQGL